MRHVQFTPEVTERPEIPMAIALGEIPAASFPALSLHSRRHVALRQRVLGKGPVEVCRELGERQRERRDVQTTERGERDTM